MTELHRNTPSQDVPTRDQIARRAYELYEQRGRQDGLDMEDWLVAERELRSQNLARLQPAPIPGQRSSAGSLREKQGKAKAAVASETPKSFDSSHSFDNHSTQ